MNEALKNKMVKNMVAMRGDTSKFVALRELSDKFQEELNYIDNLGENLTTEQVQTWSNELEAALNLAVASVSDIEATANTVDWTV